MSETPIVGNGLHWRSYVPSAAAAARYPDLGPITLQNAIVGALIYPPWFNSWVMPSLGIPGPYYGAMVGCNNPAYDLWTEMRLEYHDQYMSNLISLGSGVRLMTSDSENIQQYQVETRAEGVHQFLQSIFHYPTLGVIQNENPYTRLTVPLGFEAVANLPVARNEGLLYIWSRTNSYLRDIDTVIEIQKAANALRTRAARTKIS
jgi:hypothetical protein